MKPSDAIPPSYLASLDEIGWTSQHRKSKTLTGSNAQHHGVSQLMDVLPHQNNHLIGRLTMNTTNDNGTRYDPSRGHDASQSPATHDSAYLTVRASRNTHAGSASSRSYARSPYMPYPRRLGPQGAHGMSGSFNGAHHFVINDSIFVDGTYNSESFMKELEKHTIRGAEFDSSERDPPPRCHPGTRLSIVERTQKFFGDYRDGKRLLWIVGRAGVGKSAIMQTLAEIASDPSSDVALGASLFFSVNGRDNASKAIPTLIYQIAVQHHPYRQYVHDRMTNDPKLPTKSLQVQFRKFIIEPFIDHDIYREPKPLLIFIDGLDECADKEKQCELISLVSNFTMTHPNIPLIWVIASRPEPHIAATFSRPNIASSFAKQEVVVDSDESRADVERYLRAELERIRMKYPTLQTTAQWPKEHDYLKLSATSDGLFAFASTAVRFIDDPAYGNPATRLKQVLDVIGGIPTIPSLEGNVHPMAALDALYGRILSQIPNDILPEAKKLLLYVISNETYFLSVVCDWLGMTLDVVYGALHHLHSVFHVPSPKEVHGDGDGEFYVFHKSFLDYVRDFKRSGMFADIERDIRELDFQCSKRVFDEALDKYRYGSWNFVRCIPLFWIYEGHRHWSELMIRDIRHFLYSRSMQILWTRFSEGETDLVHYLEFFDSRMFTDPDVIISLTGSDLCNGLFDKERRNELLQHGILREMPISLLGVITLNYDHESEVSYRRKRLVFERPSLEYGPLRSCVDWDDSSDIDGHDVWRGVPKIGFAEDVLKRVQERSPDHIVVVYIDIENYGWILYECADSGDERAEWRFMIAHEFPSEIRV